MKKYLIVIILLNSYLSYSQRTKFTIEIYTNPAFTKTYMPDRFSPPFSTDTYALIFGKEEPTIGIFGYNRGLSLGVLINKSVELQLTYSKSLKGQRNSKDINQISKLIDFGMYTEHSDEFTLGFRLLDRKLFGMNRFSYLLGLIFSHYSLLKAGYYIKNNSIWSEAVIQSNAQIFDPNFSILRPGIATEIEYQLLKDAHFSLNVGLKLNQYFNSFNINFNSGLGGRPRGYAFTIGPSFKLKYQL